MLLRHVDKVCLTLVFSNNRNTASSHRNRLPQSVLVAYFVRLNDLWQKANCFAAAKNFGRSFDVFIDCVQSE